jgi:hypothetical protein
MLFKKKAINLKQKSKKLMVDISDSNFMKFQNFYKKQKPDTQCLEFSDNLFPPEKNSMCWVLPGGEVDLDLSEEERAILNSYKNWQRAEKIFNTKKFDLYKTMDIHDINQGEIGNCYFLSTISAIAEYSDRLKEIFITNTKVENGCYQINFFLNGKPKTVILDDFFPIKNPQKPYWSLAHSKENEIWVQLLEKAWAKVNGSYASTIAGLPSEAFSVLTEAPTFSYFIQKYSIDELWKIILEADQLKYIICTNTQGEVAEMTGLVKGHAYTIISAYEYENIRLLKLRNPWGSFEWTGDYSDKSELWTDQLRKFVDFTNVDDGIFYMKIEDFQKYYPHMFICRYKNNYFYEYKKFNQENRDQFICCKFTINEITNAVITLHQKQARFYRKVQNYKAVFGSLILAKYEKGKFPCYEYYNSSCSNKEKIHFELENLSPGDYHIFANINWTYETRCNFTISSYSSNKELKFEKLNIDEIPNNYLLQILNSYMSKFVKKESQADDIFVQMSLWDNKTGFFMTKFSNYSNDQFLKINLEVCRNDKIYLCKLNMDGLVTLNQTNINNNLEKDTEKDKENTINKTNNNINLSNFEILIGHNSNQIVIWRLLDHPGKVEFKINKCEFTKTYEIPKSFIHEKDDLMKFIGEQLDQTTGQKLEENLILKELEYDDSIVFVVVNNDPGITYILKIEFDNVENLIFNKENSRVLSVEPLNWRYFLIKKQSEIISSKYGMSYSIKKI